jgi:hypothetical protein
MNLCGGELVWRGEKRPSTFRRDASGVPLKSQDQRVKLEPTILRLEQAVRAERSKDYSQDQRVKLEPTILRLKQAVRAERTKDYSQDRRVKLGLVTVWFRSLEIITSLKETDYVDQAYRRF